ncbi:hypothetical protein CEP52_017768 [Fusarium oligoseptatum]|uniref:Uncharacterized protein n=1 Tax=Fusarium oligoseptatum TaxID=2604345 RepID=A0A428RGY4_9HYPO|nr:hypothetical protein CEP52_017768 [Fusarium oligoseptatum]
MFQLSLPRCNLINRIFHFCLFASGSRHGVQIAKWPTGVEDVTRDLRGAINWNVELLHRNSRLLENVVRRLLMMCDLRENAAGLLWPQPSHPSFLQCGELSVFQISRFFEPHGPSQVMAAIALPLAFWDVPSPPRQKSARHFVLVLCLAKANRSSMRFKSSEYAG